MSFGSMLENCFVEHTKGQSLNEIELFAKLEDSFIFLKHSCPRYAIGIIHGNRSHVSFEVTGDYVKDKKGTLIIRELADMMFAVASPKNKEFRIFFLQNKISHDLPEKKKFQAELLQLDLLTFRPKFKTKENYDCSILHESKLSSVGSYGIFYREKESDGIQKYNMAYSVADIIKPMKKTGKSLTRKVRIDGLWGAYSTGEGGYMQCDSCLHLHSFAYEMLNMRIGTPISDLEQLSYLFAGKAFTEFWNILKRWEYPLPDLDDAMIYNHKGASLTDSVKTVILLNADKIE